MTDENFGDVLITALEEALAFECGEGAARVRYRTLPEMDIASPPVYDAPHIRAVRYALALSQEMFARLLNVSIQTVQAWERGARPLSGPSLRLLQIAEHHPDVLRETTSR